MFIFEIFQSIHGEVNGHHQGRIVTFVRVSGCNLRCSYCDTPETQDRLAGVNMTIPEILDTVISLNNDYVCITGGEPLMNKGQMLELTGLLFDRGFKISVETNGTFDITPYFRYVESFVVDYKIGEKFVSTNLTRLRKKDVIKFLIGSYIDYVEARGVILKTPFHERKGIFAMSPQLPKMTAKELAKVMLSEKVPNTVLSVQLHKILNLK